jgi:hypothetical protein
MQLHGYPKLAHSSHDFFLKQKSDKEETVTSGTRMLLLTGPFAIAAKLAGEGI